LAALLNEGGVIPQRRNEAAYAQVDVALQTGCVGICWFQQHGTTAFAASRALLHTAAEIGPIDHATVSWTLIGLQRDRGERPISKVKHPWLSRISLSSPVDSNPPERRVAFLVLSKAMNPAQPGHMS
jgi:hypothetical protein